MSETTPAGPGLDLSVVLPAHNEVALLGSTVANLVSGLDRRALTYEVIVVENGSRDGTLRLARLLSAQIPQVRVLAQPQGNYGAALAAGIAAASGRLVATFDVDYYDLAFLDAARTLIDEKDVALVLASKRAPGASDRRPISRRGLTAAFTLLLRGVLGLSVSDAHGMKLFDRSALTACAEATVLRDSVFDVELVVRAERSGLAVAELPAAVVERRPPRSPVLARAVRTALDLVRLRLLLGPAPQRRAQSKAVRRSWQARVGRLGARAGNEIRHAASRARSARRRGPD